MLGSGLCGGQVIFGLGVGLGFVALAWWSVFVADILLLEYLEIWGGVRRFWRL